MYRLHFAPDNASLAVRLLLESLGCSYETSLVDRAARAQDGAAYRAINPAGKIPALETPHGVIFETAAILLWLEERHAGAAPAPGTTSRGDFLKWLFFTSNTLHADLRLVFYPQDSVGEDPALQARLHDHVTKRLCRHFAILDDAAGAGLPFFNASTPTALDFYVASCMRWAALYGPGGTAWYHACALPGLKTLARRLEELPAVHRAAAAEGLGPTPFSAPQPCNPPEGSAV
jgi:glutathione S-transferase